VPAAVDAATLIVSTDVPELFAIEGGLKAQLEPVGSPAQESVTAVLNPKVGAAVTVEVAEFPAVTVAGDNPLAESSKPGAVLLRSTPNPFAVGKIMSGRPSPFISETSELFRRKPVVGTSSRLAKVPSPFPRSTPLDK
jgi:hypothetical protein